MREPDQFDAFYKDARERLLLQTFCLTGDLPSSRRAVRDAFVVAWHHWRKVSLLERPESSVRPHAWRLAQRRHTARVWARQKDVDPDVKRILQALATLTIVQRRAVLLTQLAAVSMPEMAQEIGLPLEEAERELQRGATALANACEVPAAAIPALLDQVAVWLEGRVRWPRAPIIRRSGAARRRTHTTVGVAVAAAAVVVSGMLVTDGAGVHPTLDREQPASQTRDRALSNEVAVALPESTLVTETQVGEALPGPDWRMTDSADLTDSDVATLPCQERAFADRRGDAAVRRVYRAPAGAGRGAATLTQLTEASRTPRGAQRAFRTATAWYADCAQPRIQLLATRTPDAVGDASLQLILRSFAGRRPAAYVVGLARTGLFTTTTFLEVDDAAVPDRVGAVRLLGDAVGSLCTLDGGGSCSPDEPDLTDRAPIPVGDAPALLSSIDLPPVDDPAVDVPWAGTPPERPRPPLALARCANTDFTGSVGGASFSRGTSRIFFVVGSDLPDEFAITETAAALPVPAARRLMGDVRTRIAACPDRNLGTEATEVLRRDDAATSLTVWKLDVRITDDRSVTYWLASMRNGTAVGEVGFLAVGADLPPGGFVGVAERALARLGELPAPRS